MRWIFGLLCWASAAWADAFPQTYQVTDVAADDVLNIRTAADATSDIIGSYGPYAQHIEVLRTTPDGKWGFVGLGERNGWTAMRYLSPTPALADSMPRPMRCFGTEPFWSLNMFPKGDEFHALGDTRRDLSLVSERLAANGALAVFEEGPTLSRTLIISRGYCDDGMSDREFGLHATLFNDNPEGSTVLSGCCTGDASQ